MGEPSGLGPFLRHCVAEFVPEAKTAVQWDDVDGLGTVAWREERARKMLLELSSWTVSSGSPRDFVAKLPGVAGALKTGSAYLVLRMAKIHLYVAAAQGHPLKDLEALECDSLLLLGLALGIPEVERAARHRGTSAQLLSRAWPGGREEAEAVLQRELNDRVGRLESLPFARAMVGAFEFLTMAAAVDLAAVWYDDLRIEPEEVAILRRRRAERAAAVLGLLRLTARADGSVSGEEEGVLAAAREVVPTVDPADLREATARLSVERLPEVLRSAEERHGLLQSMLAVAAADGRLDPQEERLCREVAALLEVRDDAVDRMAAALTGAR